MRVIVIGGGIGGLALAQRLHGAGVDVGVYERDDHPAGRLAGYRIHIDPHGSAALHECLPPELFDAVVAHAGRGGSEFGFVTEQLRPLVHLDEELITGGPRAPRNSHHGVGRHTLHRILLHGLDDVVHPGRVFERYDHAPDGRVTAHFVDGSSTTGDVLVGADGSRSRVRAQYLPHARVTDTGIVSIVGRIPLTGDDLGWTAPFRDGPVNVVPPGRCGLFVAPHEFTAGPFADDTEPYVFWGFAARREAYAIDPDPLDGAGLRALVLAMTRGWSPVLRRLIGESDPAGLLRVPIRTAVPVDPWPSTSVTVLGDAIHSMTPFRGIGANTALRDARRLGRELIGVHRGERPLLDAVRDYEQDMIDHGFRAVRASLKAAEQTVDSGRGARIAMKTVFRAAGAVPALKRRMFAGFGDG